MIFLPERAVPVLNLKKEYRCEGKKFCVWKKVNMNESDVSDGCERQRGNELMQMARWSHENEMSRRSLHGWV